MAGIILENEEAYLQDTSGSLFSGSPVYFRTRGITYTFQNILSYKPVTKVDFNVSTGENSIGDYANYNRRKGRISYSGINLMIINLDGVFDLDSTGSFSNGKYEMTPGKLRQFLMTPRQYKFYDNKLGSALMFDSHSDVKNPWDSAGSKIPVVINSFTPSSTSESLNEVGYRLVLWEDKV